MSLGEPVSTFSESFSGQVRLFPLPGLVVFPHVVQPLHIFEPRYCEMLEEAVSTDRLIAMVLLQAGWEQDYQGRPPIAPVACLGRIVSHERLPNGKHNILLQGVQRVAIRREHPASRAFRQADVDLLEDVYPEAAAEARPAAEYYVFRWAGARATRSGQGRPPEQSGAAPDSLAPSPLAKGPSQSAGR